MAGEGCAQVGEGVHRLKRVRTGGGKGGRGVNGGGVREMHWGGRRKKDCTHVKGYIRVERRGVQGMTNLH
jgi:hypothetical protein